MVEKADNLESAKPKEQGADDAAQRLRDDIKPPDTKATPPVELARPTEDHPTLPKLEIIKQDHELIGRDQTGAAQLKAEAPDAAHPPKEELTWGEWLFGKSKPKETVDKDGNKTIDYGKGHTRVERKDGTGYDRYEEKDGKYREEHFGPNADDKFSVTGDKDGNKKTDWHNGHTKIENKDGTGYERSETADGNYTETHFGPNNNYTVVGDKAGNKLIDFQNGHQWYQAADGSGWDKVTAKDGSSTETHYGHKPEDNYTVKSDGQGNKVTDWGNGHVRTDNKDGTGSEHFPQKDGGYMENHWGPKPEDKYTISDDGKGTKTTIYNDRHQKVENADGTGAETWTNADGSYKEKHWGKKPEDNYTSTRDKDGNRTTDYGNGRTRVENKDGTGYDRTQSDDGSVFEKHFGKNPQDNYTVSVDTEGNKKTDFGGGRTKVENKDGTGYERTQYEDGSTLEQHFGKNPQDNYTVSVDTEGNKKTDYGDGHVKVENKDGTGYERTKNADGSFTEKHFGPNGKDNYTVTEDKDGKRIEHKLNEKQEQDGKVRKGEGPYQVAERLLGKDAPREEIRALVKAMRDEYLKAHPHDKLMRGLKVNEPLINSGNLSKLLGSIKDESLRKKIEAKLQH